MKEYIDIDGVVLWNDTRIQLNENELIQRDIEAAYLHFEELTTEFIFNKVREYNVSNGTKFGGIHACANYRFDMSYTHQPFCARVWEWNVRLWETVRSYQSTATVIPSDIEFQAVLDGVIF